MLEEREEFYSQSTILYKAGGEWGISLIEKEKGFFFFFLVNLRLFFANLVIFLQIWNLFYDVREYFLVSLRLDLEKVGTSLFFFSLQFTMALIRLLSIHFPYIHQLLMLFDVL